MIEFINYGTGKNEKEQALFASFFVVQNRLQTSCEKIQTEVSMKQWHLLAMTSACQKPKTLTNVAKLMGCSRQNVKKLAKSLVKKGFVNLLNGPNNSVIIKITEKANDYLKAMQGQQLKVLSHLFSMFSESEIDSFFTMQNKLLDGLEKVEFFADAFKEQV